ncbi:ribonuclease III [Gloeophyllum trabeum ATCC 11539]|uniref:Large ribosomal subunit protein mL44 n=1 Tax=Gloeophyllum trabeum (strain ATCC 11539 / FP-39264 / Madison 617) TaxID=670483 RepID=S7QAC6_GLOTA|nr:ribonuclease III [Gloeophyllum trabeum ATCC 11539]EPQ56472.1 ribonuclease III [Gloeophyllum trabeum ATCC 11539]
MGYVHKRLASTAAKLAVSPSSARAFPPPDAISNPRAFDPETYAALQPPPASSLTALAHRLGLGRVLSPTEVQQACTHPSFVTLYQKHYPNEAKPATNGNLSTVGNSLLGLFASEYLNASYPHLPLRVLKAAVSAYVGAKTCASIATEIGATPLLRWHRTTATPLKPALLLPDALSSIPRSIVALVYQHRSLPITRQFVHDLFLSREVDLRAFIKFRDPKKALKETVAKFERERPVSRLLAETGRFSNSPVFVVGIYSGADQLGEGFGTSLKMAEFRAAEDSLHRLYLTRTPPEQLRLPSSTFSPSPSDLYTYKPPKGSKLEYVAGELGMEEIEYASGGRTGLVTPPSS